MKLESINNVLRFFGLVLVVKLEKDPFEPPNGVLTDLSLMRWKTYLKTYCNKQWATLRQLNWQSTHLAQLEGRGFDARTGPFMKKTHINEGNYAPVPNQAICHSGSWMTRDQMVLVDDPRMATCPSCLRIWLWMMWEDGNIEFKDLKDI